MYYLYILRCRGGSLYTGITTDIERRLAEHRCGIGSRYTRSHLPVKLVYTEEYSNRREATKRECQIKGWSKVEKENYLNSSLKVGSN